VIAQSLIDLQLVLLPREKDCVYHVIFQSVCLCLPYVLGATSFYEQLVSLSVSMPSKDRLLIIFMVIMMFLYFFNTILFSLIHIVMANNLSQTNLTHKLFYERSNIDER
jgi:hypothetical protein